MASAQRLVEKVRGVPFPGTVASAILHEKDLARVLARKLVEDLPAPFPRYAASLAAVGFFDPEPGLEQKLTTLYARQVAGFYDPAEKKFFIVPERTAETAVAGAPTLGLSAETLLEDTLLAHELTHALQDRRLDLVPRLKALQRFVRRPPRARGISRRRGHRRDDGRAPDPAAGRVEGALRRETPSRR